MSVESPSLAVIAEGVQVRFGARTAVADCSFTVPAGAVVALLGRNGAGKTTLLRVVAGLLSPDRGNLRVFGQPVDARVLPRIGYVAQHAPLYPMLTVDETLRLGARTNPHWDAPFARRLVAAAALPTGTRVDTLSAGERMRLALAMALGKRPDLLVLDEPLAALDPVRRAEIVGSVMAEVAERGITVIMSSHVVADIQEVCDHVLVLGDGRVRLAAEVEVALAGHRLAVGSAADLDALGGLDVIELRPADGGFTALVRTTEARRTGAMSWHRPTLDELLLGYLRGSAPGPTLQLSGA